MAKVEQLRSSGEIVVTYLGAGDADDNEMQALRCDRRLVQQGTQWVVE